LFSLSEYLFPTSPPAVVDSRHHKEERDAVTGSKERRELMSRVAKRGEEDGAGAGEEHTEGR
jgi:hypothetical protein